jgi:FixJ family two-component response regulator
MNDRARIAVVDDDESVRESLPDLLRLSGYDTVAFASARAFLDSGRIDSLDCLILDVAMPGMSGPELQQELKRGGHQVPIIFITAHSIDGVWPVLLRSGAVARLTKPFSEDAILDAIGIALRHE